MCVCHRVRGGQSVCCSYFSSVTTETLRWIIGVFSLKRVCEGSRRGRNHTHTSTFTSTPPYSHSQFSSLCVCSRPVSRRLGPLLSPLEGGRFEFLTIFVDAWRAGVQLDKELGEFVLGEHRLQEALQENVD